MLNFGRLIVVIVACLVAAPADAQTLSNARRTFIDVPFAADWDDAYSDSTRVPGATWGSGLAFGLDWGRSGVEVDVGMPQWHVKHRAPERYGYAGPSVGWERQGHVYEWSATTRRRSVDVTVLYRGNVPVNRRVTFTWLAGGGFVVRPDRYSVVTNEVLPGGQLIEANRSHSTSFRNYKAAVARLDLEVRVTPHLSVVPRLRVTAFPSLLDDSGTAPRMLVARPEVAVRWRF